MVVSELFRDKPQTHILQVFQVLCVNQNETADIFMETQKKIDSSVVHVHGFGSVRTTKRSVE